MHSIVNTNSKIFTFVAIGAIYYAFFTDKRDFF